MTATDLTLSVGYHYYELNYLLQGGEPGQAEVTVTGEASAKLTATVVGSRADLVLELDKSELGSPLPVLEYQVKRNGFSLLLEWVETEEAEVVRCTATDDTAEANYNRYEVGVRTDVETFYANTNLSPEEERVDAGPIADAASGSDSGLPSGDGDGGGCATTRPSRWPLLLLLVALLWRRRL